MHPEFIRIGDFAINSYGVLVALGFLLGLMLAAKRAQVAGIEPRHISDLGVVLVLAGMGSAKIFYIVFFWDDFLAGWRDAGVKSLREGFVFYGGFIGASIGTIIFARRRGLALWQLADVMAPSVALGHALGRLGCFFNGCCYGKACTLAWAVHYPKPHLMHDIPVHPTQVYEALGNALLLGWLLWLTGRKKFTGQVWWCYVLSYGVLRFVIEFARGDYPIRYVGGLTLGHLVAIGMMGIALGAMWFLGRQKTKLQS